MFDRTEQLPARPSSSLGKRFHDGLQDHLGRRPRQHQRHFQQALAQLQKLRAEKRKAEIGFVSQKAIEAEETRRAAAETRKAEDHKITMEIKQQRCEREKSLSTMAAIKAADKMHESLPPNRQELAAEMPRKAA